MVVYYPTLGGELRQHSYQPMVSGITGVWVRVNTIHDVGAGKCDVYINGTLEATVNQGSGPWYHKYGVYNASTQGAKAEWRDVKFFTYTGGTSPTPTPAPTATPGPRPTSTPTATPMPTATPGGGFSGYYRVTARHSGKALTVQSASTANSANVFQWTYGGSNTNDEWEVRSIGGGYYRVIARHSGKDLTVQSASTAEGANIFQYTYGGSATNDEWALVDVGSGYFRITNRNSGKSAEVAGGGTADGTNVNQRTYSGASHQQWQLVSVP
jgi:predicted nucleic acid-binding Zn ribbon protein